MQFCYCIIISIVRRIWNWMSWCWCWCVSVFATLCCRLSFYFWIFNQMKPTCYVQKRTDLKRLWWFLEYGLTRNIFCFWNLSIFQCIEWSLCASHPFQIYKWCVDLTLESYGYLSVKGHLKPFSLRYCATQCGSGIFNNIKSMVYIIIMIIINLWFMKCKTVIQSLFCTVLYCIQY